MPISVLADNNIMETNDKVLKYKNNNYKKYNRSYEGRKYSQEFLECLYANKIIKEYMIQGFSLNEEDLAVYIAIFI